MNLRLYSKGLYSSFGLHYPSRTLFDAGDGAGTMLSTHLFAAERVCISHGHSDHLSSLPAVVGLRSCMKGASDKPLTIYAPDSRNWKAYRQLISAVYPRLNYPLTFEDIYGGYQIPLTERSWIEAFDVQHTYGSLGYKVMEKRTRLKPGVTPADVKDLLRRGEQVHETYEGNTFTWLLDSAKFDLEHIKDSAWVIGDSTFLDAADRDDKTHATVDEVLGWCREAGVKRVSLAHISVRYPWDEVRARLPGLVKASGFTGQVDLVLGDDLYEFD